jgi:glycosyltransferase involved in cell wall biosynthesis
VASAGNPATCFPPAFSDGAARSSARGRVLEESLQFLLEGVRSNDLTILLMISANKLIVVMPAYNAEKTLRQTYAELPHEYVDDVVLVDDASNDHTTMVARELGIKTIIHRNNRGYGGNQKTCYREALRLGADIVVMVHPDYQYSPRLVTAMASMISSGHYDVVLGSRILGGQALRGGMPVYKYIANRFLTFVENVMVGVKLSEYHTGYRAFSRSVLERLPIESNSDGYLFDNELIVQAVHFGFRIGEISCPTRYFPEASSINFLKSMEYGIGVIVTSIKYALQRTGISDFKIFHDKLRKAVGVK